MPKPSSEDDPDSSKYYIIFKKAPSDLISVGSKPSSPHVILIPSTVSTLSRGYFFSLTYPVYR